MHPALPPPPVFAGSLTFCRAPPCSARTMPVTLVPNTSRHLCERNIHGDGDKHFFFFTLLIMYFNMYSEKYITHFNIRAKDF